VFGDWKNPFAGTGIELQIIQPTGLSLDWLLSELCIGYLVMCVSLWNIATRWENSIKAVECENCDWNQLAKDRVHVCKNGNEIFGSIYTGNL
jgi:hypothetical protein